MPELRRGDARIHYEVRGSEGPALVLATYWSWIPGVWDELLDELSADHRVVVYHLRGTGDSSREGPFDMATDLGDLEAVVEQAGGPAALLSTADGASRSVALAARRPDLAGVVVSLGAAPLGRTQMEGTEE